MILPLKFVFYGSPPSFVRWCSTHSKLNFGLPLWRGTLGLRQIRHHGVDGSRPIPPSFGTGNDGIKQGADVISKLYSNS